MNTESQKHRTPQGEELSLDYDDSGYWVVRLKSPVHGLWMVVEVCETEADAKQRMHHWESEQ